ncbi:DUF92 domain-containing protein [Agriterribacter sp.]|uniref:DUF92 domain-containing protein n=1 Tax=Agriterribacter sp. TaxID=2821509 RepID=UPI002CAC6643|nr:DUF92 domain-containing protein [Agriterribacter sp.]HRO47267.1 DUF92 domain-containing protein [Agriterribacter sp.]HRQ16569.1 DUF92 domain-containing protein [Agriterribacter sp.]
MNASYLAAFIIITAGMLISMLKKKLTVAAALTGGLLSVIIFIGAGFTGIGLLAAFFILGVSATGWKVSAKMKDGLAESGNGERNTGQVFANAGAAAILALLAKYNPEAAEVLYLMIAGCFSAATADTLSSELGNVYGKSYYHMLTFRKMQRGANGAVSLQGSIYGIIGSIIIALIYVLGTGWNAQHFLVIIIAGTAGNAVDSILGLTLENKGLLNNNAVNFLNTAVGAAVAGVLYKL